MLRMSLHRFIFAFVVGNLLVQGLPVDESGRRVAQTVEVAPNNKSLPALEETATSGKSDSSSIGLAGSPSISATPAANQNASTAENALSVDKAIGSETAPVSNKDTNPDRSKAKETRKLDGSEEQSRTTIDGTATADKEPSTSSSESATASSSAVTNGTATTEQGETTTSPASTISTKSTEATTAPAETTKSVETASTQTTSTTTLGPKQSAIHAEISDEGMSSGVIALVMAISFAVVVTIVYAGLLLWRRYLEYRYGNRELLVNDLEFDTNDLRHFEL